MQQQKELNIYSCGNGDIAQTNHNDDVVNNDEVDDNDRSVNNLHTKNNQANNTEETNIICIKKC